MNTSSPYHLNKNENKTRKKEKEKRKKRRVKHYVLRDADEYIVHSAYKD
jgi:hypothetical protein